MKTKWECFHCNRELVSKSEAQDHITTCEKNPVQVDFKRLQAEHAELEKERNRIEQKLSAKVSDYDTLLLNFNLLLADYKAVCTEAEHWRREHVNAVEKGVQRNRIREMHDPVYALFRRHIHRSIRSHALGGSIISQEELLVLCEEAKDVDIQKLVGLAMEFDIDLKLDLVEEARK